MSLLLAEVQPCVQFYLDHGFRCGDAEARQDTARLKGHQLLVPRRVQRGCRSSLKMAHENAGVKTQEAQVVPRERGPLKLQTRFYWFTLRGCTRVHYSYKGSL